MTAYTDPCSRVSGLVEAIAAGDLAIEADVRAHFESCPRCAAALASARRIETLLAAREAPSAPPRFTAAVLASVRRERWRAEQQVDRLFNIAIAAAILLVAGGVVAILNVGTVLGAAASLWNAAALAAGERLTREGPSLLTYAASAAFMASGLAMWWWAERRFSIWD